MTQREQDIDNSTLHRTATFGSGARAVLSTAFFTALGVVVGHSLGRWGEEKHNFGSGMSSRLGRWMVGGLFGGLAAYVSLRGSAEQEHERVDLEARNAALEEKVKILEAHLPEHKVQATTLEHAGAVETPALDRAI